MDTKLWRWCQDARGRVVYTRGTPGGHDSYSLHSIKHQRLCSICLVGVPTIVGCRGSRLWHACLKWTAHCITLDGNHRHILICIGLGRGHKKSHMTRKVTVASLAQSEVAEAPMHDRQHCWSNLIHILSSFTLRWKCKRRAASSGLTTSHNAWVARMRCSSPPFSRCSTICAVHEAAKSCELSPYPCFLL